MGEIAKKVTDLNFKPGKGNGRFRVYSEQFNKLVDAILELEGSDGVLTPDSVTVAGSASGTDAITVTAGDITLTSGDLTVTAGAATLGEEVIFSGIETIAAGGTTTAADLTKSLHSVDADAGGDIVTLADGTIGQIMTFACVSATGVLTLTPANLAGGTSVTMNAAGETVILQFVDTQWYIMGGNAYTVI